MKDPLFRVGEEVVVVSNLCPECNGESVVLELKWGTMLCSDGVEYTGWCYKTEDQPNKNLHYRESSLRKKHKGSDYSFQQLVSSLNKIEA